MKFLFLGNHASPALSSGFHERSSGNLIFSLISSFYKSRWNECPCASFGSRTASGVGLREKRPPSPTEPVISEIHLLQDKGEPMERNPQRVKWTLGNRGIVWESVFIFNQQQIKSIFPKLSLFYP